jgi:hypothetical protein
MDSVARVIKVLLLLVVTFVAVTLVIALVGAQTGMTEKGVLIAMIAGCLGLAARIPAWTDSAMRNLPPH